MRPNVSKNSSPRAGEPGEGENPLSMGMRRLLGDLREARALLAELANSRDADERASLELAISTRRFTRRAQKVVDDKLSFSAVLMRAGEVDAANRLLGEVEADVRSEEAALMEKVNEVKVSETLRRERVTRARLVRTLVAAMVGASLLAFSAAGMAVAGMFRDQERAAVDAALNDLSAVALAVRAGKLPETSSSGLREIEIGGVKFALSAKQIDAYNALTSGTIDGAEFQELLLSLPTKMAERVQALVIAAKGDVRAALDPATQVLSLRLNRAKKKKADKQESQEAQPADEETPQPPEEEPQPEPSESGGESQDGGDESPDDGDGVSYDPDGSGPLPGLGDD